MWESAKVEMRQFPRHGVAIDAPLQVAAPAKYLRSRGRRCCMGIVADEVGSPSRRATIGAAFAGTVPANRHPEGGVYPRRGRARLKRDRCLSAAFLAAKVLKLIEQLPADAAFDSASSQSKSGEGGT